jgi:hypothetical protein
MRALVSSWQRFALRSSLTRRRHSDYVRSKVKLSAQSFIPCYGSLSAYLTFDSHLTQETIIRFVRIKDVVFSTKGRVMLEKVLLDRNPTQLHYQTAADLIGAILGKFPL